MPPLRSQPPKEKIIFQSLNDAANFINHYRVVFGVEQPSEIFKNEYRPKSKQIVKVHVSLTLLLPPQARNQSHAKREMVMGVGEAESLRMARKMARMDLAHKLHAGLADPQILLPSKKSASSTDHPQISVSLPGNITSSLHKLYDGLDQRGTFFSLDQSSLQMEQSRIDWEERVDVLETVRRVSPNILQQYPRPLLGASTTTSGSTPSPLSLPINSLYHQIINSIEQNHVTILSAATGSGKTTQVPQFILDNYLQARQHYASPPSVIITQPRRIAAKTVALRVAEERSRMAISCMADPSSSIGYSVRFENRPPTSRRDGAVLFCTAGVLLRKLQGDPLLRSITHLILDEVHERDIFTDIMLLILRNLLRVRPDLRVILMSATIQAERLVEYFAQDGYHVGKIADIEGTNYPVEEYYLEDVINLLRNSKNLIASSPETHRYLQAELQACNQGETEKHAKMTSILIEEPELRLVPYELLASLIGHLVRRGEKRETFGGSSKEAILVFLPGWEEISTLYRLLAESGGRYVDGGRCQFHLLHSTSPISSTEAAFQKAPPHQHKIILATNIAESSVTIPDVGHVIDLGRQKVMMYDVRNRMNSLESCWISKANLRQRLGRAGRCQEGKYYALFSKARADILPEQTDPEILRLSLDEVCLHLKAIGLSQPSQHLLRQAVDSPPSTTIRTSIQRLKALGALDQDESLTPLGRLLANIPIHPGKGEKGLAFPH